ncbi:unnamed protein product [Cuscuta epithymum]|uniref:PROP1-like PPR domain-containing protein n=2 Tax=Cuscuta epithymum TaxID=186058 RepID=A0AAV0EMS1_9ASTE|nr:unnamed protein product [Cuscuta epithymum]
METAFPSKARTLSQVSFSAVGPPTFYSHRVRFLGRGYHFGSSFSLRPPGLCSRRRCRKLIGIKFRTHSSRSLPVAHLSSATVVVLASSIVISALTIVFVLVSRKSTKANQALNELAVAFNHQIRNKVRVVVDRFFHPTAKWKDKANGSSSRRMAEASHAEHRIMEGMMQTSQDGLMRSTVNKVECPHPNTTTSRVVDSPVSLASEDASSSSKKDEFLTTSEAESEAHELYTVESLQESKITTDLPKAVLSSGSGVSLTAANTLTEKVDDILQQRHQPIAGSKMITHSIFFREPERKELYRFYEASAENQQGDEFGERVLGKSKNISNAKGISIIQSKCSRKASRSPGPKGKNTSNIHHISEQVDAYHHFLRSGRLTDCLRILEDMDNDGLLNTDKVYHAGFFQACRNEKAVSEAFRFTKLIHNPTLSTFNLLLSVCASCQDLEGAFRVLQLVKEAGLNADCKLYTTLISTCAKIGKINTMFEVFNKMVNAGVEPNVHTFGALIDGCAKAGQVSKAFSAYETMLSMHVKPDRVVFNSLITACGQSGEANQAFDVLAKMREGTHPIDPDHITIGALMKACLNTGQDDRVRDVYNLIHEYNIKGGAELYTIAVNSFSEKGDWELACSIFNDMDKKGIAPDELFISAMVDAAGHAGKLDAAFELLKEARNNGVYTGTISYSSLMGACCNTKNWQKALQLYDEIKDMKLKRTVPMMNALITALCDAEKLQEAVDVLFEMKREGLLPNSITYSVLLVASEMSDDLDTGLMLLSEAKKDGVAPNLVMYSCLMGMCLRRFQKACTLGEPVLSYNSVQIQLNNKWTSLALMMYRETIAAGLTPTVKELSQVLGCLQLPRNACFKARLVEDHVFTFDDSKSSNLCSLIDGFGEYDPRAFQLIEEASSLGLIPLACLKGSPIVVNVKDLQIHTVEVYILTVLRGLKRRLAAGVRIPNITILLPVEQSQFQTPTEERTIKIAGRISQEVAALLRRLGLPYLGSGSLGKIQIKGISLRKWLQPKVEFPFSGEPTSLSFSETRLGKGITHQQRKIRTGDLSVQ